MSWPAAKSPRRTQNIGETAACARPKRNYHALRQRILASTIPSIATEELFLAFSGEIG